MAKDPAAPEVAAPPPHPALFAALASEYCPPLDRSLLIALLSDLSHPPNPSDEAAIRSTLKTLADSWNANSGSESDGSVQQEEEVWEEIPAEGLEDVSVWDLGDQDDLGTKVTFLRSLCPHISDEMLVAKLTMETGDDGKALSIETIVEELLNEEFITSATQDSSDSGYSSGGYGGDSDRTGGSGFGRTGALFDQGDYEIYEDACSDSAGPTRAERKRAKASNKAALTTSLTSPILLESRLSATANEWSTSAPQAWKPTPRKERPMTAEEEVRLESTISFLSPLINYPANDIRSFYKRHRASQTGVAWLTALIRMIASSRANFPQTADTENLLEFIGEGGHKEMRNNAEMLLMCTSSDLMSAFEIYGRLKEAEEEARIEAENLAKEDESFSAAIPQSVLRWDQRPGVVTIAETEDWRETARKERAHREQEDREEMSWDPKFCEAKAAEFEQKKAEAMAQARKLARDPLGRAGLPVYADRIREYNTEARNWKSKAMVSRVRSRQVKSGNYFEYDLHQLDSAHAIKVVEDACLSWYSRPDTSAATPLRIITGVGNHSRGGKGVLGEAVAGYLTRHGWQWRWEGQASKRTGTYGALVVTGVKGRTKT
ncbi:smr domain containing protein [Pseudohyphozyma bogoriensis]|nr:smr domain containing protein [Pseudohyphozyma bogoriensis]